MQLAFFMRERQKWTQDLIGLLLDQGDGHKRNRLDLDLDLDLLGLGLGLSWDLLVTRARSWSYLATWSWILDKIYRSPAMCVNTH